MASGGFMNLAYMAELAVVVNLAYLELKSLRYIQAARDSVAEILRKLSDDNKNQNGGTVVGNEQFMALYQQAKNIFHDDTDEREKEWYVITDSKEEKKNGSNPVQRTFTPFSLKTGIKKLLASS